MPVWLVTLEYSVSDFRSSKCSCDRLGQAARRDAACSFLESGPASEGMYDKKTISGGVF